MEACHKVTAGGQVGSVRKGGRRKDGGPRAPEDWMQPGQC